MLRELEEEIERRKLAANQEAAAANPEQADWVKDYQEKKKKGRSPEEMREMTRQRMEMAKTDPSKKGGRGRKKQVELETMLPDALQVLRANLNSPDERIAQKAALEIIAWMKGKPSQSVKMEGEQIHTIRYESAAWTAGQIEEAEWEPLPLPEAS